MAELKLGTTIGGSVAWHEGNDGSGSGLDADYLDGNHASAFALSGHTHNYAGSSSAGGSASSVANSVTFTSSGGAAAGTTFNGSSAVTVDYTTLGAAPASHTHAYLSAESDTLATVTSRGASTGTNVTLSGGGNQFNGHFYLLPYDDAGNHYPHFNDGSSNSGSKINWRLFTGGTNSVTHTWTTALATFSTNVTVNGSSAQDNGTLLVNNTRSSGSFYPALKVVNARGDHSYGTVAEFRTATTADSDRPSILFSKEGNSNNWALGMGVYAGSIDSFSIGYRSTYPIAAWSTAYLTILTNGNVGVGVTNPGYKLEVNGSFAATSKSFLIPHPTKEGWKLRYGSLEGPENGVYIRGKLKGKSKIELPEYWTKLVDPDSITVSLTPIGKHQKLYVEDISNNVVTVANDGLFAGEINCFFVVYGERVDIDKLVVEYE